MLFASPWFLLGSLAAAVPVLIHLYGRRRARRVLFPSLMLIQAAQRERTSLVRLRQLWLMLLRAAALLLMSLALARPSFPWVHVAADSEGLAVLLVDDSLSMRTRSPARSRFEQARQTAEELLRGLPAGQQAALATASQPAEPVYGTPASLQAAVTRLTPTYAAADLPETLCRLAEALAPQDYPRRHFYVLTDLQASGWVAPTALQRTDTVTVIDCGQEVSNHAVTVVEVAEPPALPGRPVQLTAQARQYGRASADLQVKVRVGDGVLPPAPLGFRGGQGRVLLDWEPARAGTVGVTASLPPDLLREDDSGCLAVEVRDRLRVALLGPDTQTRWARLALAPDERSRLRVESRIVTGETDVALLWQPADARSLGALTQAGGGVLAFLESFRPGDLRALLPESALSLGPLRSLSAGLHLSTFEVFSAPLQPFANPAAGDLQEPLFRRRHDLTLPPGSPLEVLARYSDGVPALLRGRVGTGRLLLANFGVTPDASDLPQQPVFVPLLHRLVGYLARRPWPALETLTAGEQLTLAPPAGAEAPRLAGPNGQPVAVPVTAAGWSLPLAQPGLYRLQWRQQGAERTAMLAVNADPAESDPGRLAPAEVVRRLQPAAATVVAPAQAPAQVRRAPLALATPLLLLAFLLLLAELWLSAAEPRQRAGEPSTGASR